MDKAQQDALKKAAGIEAAKLIQNGMIAGLGTGSTVRFLVDELGRRVKEEGLEFTGVTTSRRTQEQAEGYGIKIVNIDDVDHIDVTIDGADEVDMVINLAMVKDGCWDDVAADIRAVREVSRGRILKVIIECCLLTEEEKRMLCRIVSDSGADYIKTSTGFSTGGATADDVRLLRTCCPPHVKVKAAGGIASLADAEEFIRLGADRLGTSRIVKIAMAQEQQAAEAAAAPQQPEAAAQPETPAQPQAPEQQDTTY